METKKMFVKKIKSKMYGGGREIFRSASSGDPKWTSP